MPPCYWLLASAACLGYVSAAHLRSGVVPKVSNTTIASSLWHHPPCACEANSPAWKAATRTVPKCVFFDIGAGDGSTFQEFLKNYDPVANCPSGQWEAYLLEANPQFDVPLETLSAQYPGQIHVSSSTAAYSCAGQSSFYINADPTYESGPIMSVYNYKKGKQSVNVPTINLAQLIAEHVTPEDWVMLKVDIEGAEYDVVPCLAKSDKSKLVDRMQLEEQYLEGHTWFKTGSTMGQEELNAAMRTMKTKGVDIRSHFSRTL